MTRFLSLIAVAALIAGPASAADFHIKVIGKSDAAVQQDINIAAKKMCASYLNGNSRALEPASSCLKFAVRDAQAQLTDIRLAQGKTDNVRVASTR